MAALLIKDMPVELHEKLKETAKRHHRSMNREAITILEQSLLGTNESFESRPAPIPIKGKFPITQKFLNWAKNEGRK